MDFAGIQTFTSNAPKRVTKKKKTVSKVPTAPAVIPGPAVPSPPSPQVVVPPTPVVEPSVPNWEPPSVVHRPAFQPSAAESSPLSTASSVSARSNSPSVFNESSSLFGDSTADDFDALLRPGQGNSQSSTAWSTATQFSTNSTNTASTTPTSRSPASFTNSTATSVPSNATKDASSLFSASSDDADDWSSWGASAEKPKASTDSLTHAPPTHVEPTPAIAALRSSSSLASSSSSLPDASDLFGASAGGDFIEDPIFGQPHQPAPSPPISRASPNLGGTVVSAHPPALGHSGDHFDLTSSWDQPTQPSPIEPPGHTHPSAQPSPSSVLQTWDFTPSLSNDRKQPKTPAKTAPSFKPTVEPPPPSTKRASPPSPPPALPTPSSPVMHSWDFTPSLSNERKQLPAPKPVAEPKLSSSSSAVGFASDLLASADSADPFAFTSQPRSEPPASEASNLPSISKPTAADHSQPPKAVSLFDSKPTAQSGFEADWLNPKPSTSSATANPFLTGDTWTPPAPIEVSIPQDPHAIVSSPVASKPASSLFGGPIESKSDDSGKVSPLSQSRDDLQEVSLNDSPAVATPSHTADSGAKRLFGLPKTPSAITSFASNFIKSLASDIQSTGSSEDSFDSGDEDLVKPPPPAPEILASLSHLPPAPATPPLPFSDTYPKQATGIGSIFSSLATSIILGNPSHTAPVDPPPATSPPLVSTHALDARPDTPIQAPTSIPMLVAVPHGGPARPEPASASVPPPSGKRKKEDASKARGRRYNVPASLASAVTPAEPSPAPTVAPFQPSTAPMPSIAPFQPATPAVAPFQPSTGATQPPSGPFVPTHPSSSSGPFDSIPKPAIEPPAPRTPPMPTHSPVQAPVQAIVPPVAAKSAGVGAPPPSGKARRSEHNVTATNTSNRRFVHNVVPTAAPAQTPAFLSPSPITEPPFGAPAAFTPAPVELPSPQAPQDKIQPRTGQVSDLFSAATTSEPTEASSQPLSWSTDSPTKPGGLSGLFGSIKNASKALASKALEAALSSSSPSISPPPSPKPSAHSDSAPFEAVVPASPALPEPSTSFLHEEPAVTAAVVLHVQPVEPPPKRSRPAKPSGGRSLPPAFIPATTPAAFVPSTAAPGVEALFGASPSATPFDVFAPSTEKPQASHVSPPVEKPQPASSSHIPSSLEVAELKVLLASKAKDLEALKESSKRQIADLQAQNDQTSKQLRQVSLDRDHIQQRPSASGRPSSELLTNLVSRNTTLEFENAELQAKLKRLQKTNESLTQQLDESDKGRYEAERKLAEAELDVKEKYSALQVLQAQNAELSRLHRLSTAAKPPPSPGPVTEDPKSLKSYYEGKVKHLTEKNLDLQSQLEAFQQIVEDATRTKKEASARLSHSDLGWRVEKQELTEQIEALSAQHRTSQAKLNTATETIRSLQAGLSASERSVPVENLQKALDQAQHDKALLETRVASAEAKALIYLKEKEAIEKETEELRRMQASTRQALLDTRMLVESVQSEKGHMNTVVSQYKTQLEGYESRIHVQAQLTTKQTQVIENLMSENAQLINALDFAKRMSFESKEQGQMEALHKERNFLLKTVSNLQSEIQTLKAQIDAQPQHASETASTVTASPPPNAAVSFTPPFPEFRIEKSLVASPAKEKSTPSKAHKSHKGHSHDHDHDHDHDHSHADVHDPQPPAKADRTRPATPKRPVVAALPKGPTATGPGSPGPSLKPAETLAVPQGHAQPLQPQPSGGWFSFWR